MKKLALLISGGGTTATAILNECKPGGRLHGLIQPVLVIASKPGIKGIERALATGMISDENVVVIPRKGHSTAESFGSAILRECKLSRKVDVIGQYGWLPKTPRNVIEAFPKAMINQHPGPLSPGPHAYFDFGGQGMYGRRVHCARLYYVRATGNNQPWTEATAHWVEPELDKGAVIKARKVPILPDDDVTSLQERVLPVEHEVQIEALIDFALDRVVEIVRPEEESFTEFKILMKAIESAKLLYPNG